MQYIDMISSAKPFYSFWRNKTNDNYTRTLPTIDK